MKPKRLFLLIVLLILLPSLFLFSSEEEGEEGILGMLEGFPEFSEYMGDGSYLKGEERSPKSILFDGREVDFSKIDKRYVLLNGSSIKTKGKYSDVALIDNGEAFIIKTLSSSPLNLVLRGDFERELIVESKNVLLLTLDGVRIESESSGALTLNCPENSYIFLKSGRWNTLSDSPFSADEAVLFSNGSLGIFGSGSLEIDSYSHSALVADELDIIGGSISIYVDPESKGNGIEASSFVQSGGEVKVNAVGSFECYESIGIRLLDPSGTSSFRMCGGSLDIFSVSRGVELLGSLSSFAMENGVLSIITTGLPSSFGKEALSPYGIFSGNKIELNGGLVQIGSTDSALYAKRIFINDGIAYLYSRSTESLVAEKSLVINGGVIGAIGSNLVDANKSAKGGSFDFNGGTLFAFGGDYMSLPDDSLSKGYALIFPFEIKNEDTVAIVSEFGPIAIMSMPLYGGNYNGGMILSDRIEKGESYTLSLNGEFSSEFSYNGILIGNLRYMGGEVLSNTKVVDKITKMVPYTSTSE